jgi:hypothetical protein
MDRESTDNVEMIQKMEHLQVILFIHGSSIPAAWR